jgi:MFS transporter, DHA1 family, multidrug resistance protein
MVYCGLIPDMIADDKITEQGFVGGMNSMFTSLANISGPILGGILFDIDINYPYYFATVILTIGIVITLFWKKQANRSSIEVKAS